MRDGLEGLEALLRLLVPRAGSLGLSHLLLQLHVLHEYVRLDPSELDADLDEVEKHFGMFALLEQWSADAVELERVYGI